MEIEMRWNSALAFVSLGLVLGCGGAGESFDELAVDSVSSEPVELVQAWRYSGSRYGYDWTNSWFRIVVEDRAFDKQVEIWTQGYDGAWKAIPASYVEDVGENREVWEAEEHAEGGRASGAFVARYRVGGQTFWDNNNGRDYEMKDSGGYLPDGVDVKLWRSGHGFDEISPNAYSVAVDIRNLAYGKKVEVVYTTDDWKTVRTKDLSFSGDYMYGYGYVHSPNRHAIERWGGSVDVTGADELEFAIAYTVDGQTHWDNNFGANYHVRRRD